MTDPIPEPGALGDGVTLTNWRIVEGEENICGLPPFADILRILDRKKGARGMLSRADVDPVAFKRYLPRMTLFELEFDREGTVGDAMIRLMGTEVVHFYGEFTGRRVSEYPDRAVPRRIISCLSYLVRHRVPVAATVDGIRKGKRHVGLRILYVPLSDDEVRVNRALSFSFYYFPSLER